MATAEEKDAAYSIYMNNLGEAYNFYASQADEDGLVAVFKAGVEAGRAERDAS